MGNARSVEDAGQPEGKRRKQGKQGKAHQIGTKEWYDTPVDRSQADILVHGIQHHDIDADRWREHVSVII